MSSQQPAKVIPKDLELECTECETRVPYIYLRPKTEYLGSKNSAEFLGWKTGGTMDTKLNDIWLFKWRCKICGHN